MAKLKKGLIPLVALLYLVAFGFFIWGVAAGSYKIFPWKQMATVYDELHAFFTFQGGTHTSAQDKIVLDRQEKRTEYNFTGFRLRDPGFQDTGYLLISRYSKKHKQVIAELFSIASNKVLHTWMPSQSEIFEKSKDMETNVTRDLASFAIQHPVLLKDGDLVFNTEQGPLVRIDACGNTVWVIARHFHHSIEIDSNRNIVTCIVADAQIPETIYPIRDDGIAIVSLEGDILKEYSITESLLNNGYSGLVYGVGLFEEDRIHLNDAQPILKPSVDADVGDIALSIRNLSTVTLFSPHQGEIKWLKTGPWLNQHDISQSGDGSYSIFGNDIARNSENGGRYVNDDRSEVYIGCSGVKKT